jgi:hypothetical protein
LRTAERIRQSALVARQRDYSALRAERRADRLARRPKQRKLKALCAVGRGGAGGLVAGWLPEQISARLRLDHPDDMQMRVSPETIYQSWFAQAQGELRHQLKGDLRSGRTRRKQRAGLDRRGRMVGMISISPDRLNPRCISRQIRRQGGGLPCQAPIRCPARQGPDPRAEMSCYARLAERGLAAHEGGALQRLTGRLDRG